MQILLERHAQFLDGVGDLLAHVQAVGELAAEDGDHATLAVGLDGVLAAQRGPFHGVGVAGGGLHHQRPHPAPLGDDVGRGERAQQVEACVDLPEQELAVLVGDLGERLVDPGVGGADDRTPAHRDDVEQALRVVEERQHALVLAGGEPRHHEVNALRVHDLVVGAGAPRLVQLVDERPRRVDDDPRHGGVGGAGVGVAQLGTPPVALPRGADQFDVVGGRRTGLERRSDEREHESRIVVDEVRVAVLDAATHRVGVDGRLVALDGLLAQNARRARAELADGPVTECAQPREPWRVRRGLVEAGEEADLLDVVGIRLHQPVARAAQLEHERELVVLEVLEATPHQVRRLLAGERAEVAAVDECHGGATARQRRGRHGAVDAATHDQHVERSAVDASQVCVT